MSARGKLGNVPGLLCPLPPHLPYDEGGLVA